MQILAKSDCQLTLVVALEIDQAYHTLSTESLEAPPHLIYTFQHMHSVTLSDKSNSSVRKSVSYFGESTIIL